MPYGRFAMTVAHETISSNEQQSKSSKTNIHKEINGDIFAFLSLTRRAEICYNNPRINLDKAVCDPVTMN